ncbi:MAG: pyridoxal-phosphate dependent enzyme [Deltaproteobacteria bacterium]|nr:pyridoxal-phosphate dependent enzyme [Nannocystaceae bacterium]
MTPAQPLAQAGPLWPRLEHPPQRFAWARLPTAVERAAWLDGPRTQVWIKRDDASSDRYGGGKVRKLQWVLANPPYDGDRPILSIGGTGSHHLLALALHLQPLGRELHALTFVQPWTDHARRNFSVLVSSGAKIWAVGSRPALPLAWLAYRTWRRPPRGGVYMAAGASTPLGCFGFVEAALELAAQIEAGELPKPDVVYVTAGSAGTCVGLALGLALAGVSTRLHLVSSVERWAFNRLLFDRLLGQAHAELRRRGLPEAHGRSARRWLADARIEVVIDHAQVGGGYGVPTEAAHAAHVRAAAHGLGLETTYTAKCLAALLHHEHTRSEGEPRNVLMWNTHAGNDLAGSIVDDWRARSPIVVPGEDAP